MCHSQENVILHSTHTIFNEKFFFKYTDFHVKEHKLYNKLLDKINPETESLMHEPFSKNRPALVSVLFTPIPPVKNNPPSHSSSSSPSISYKSLSLLFSLMPKLFSVRVEEVNNNIDTDVMIMPHI